MGYQNLLRALKSEILGAQMATMSKTLILVPGTPDFLNLYFEFRDKKYTVW